MALDYEKYQNKLKYVRPSKDHDAFRAYENETHRLMSAFRSDLFEEYAVADNPRAAKAFDLAWSQGHAHGLHEVETYFEELADLIR